jgi:two-component system NtrC family response regulator
MRSDRILVVEDDDTVRSVTRAYLAKIGYKTTEAADVPAALEVLRSEPQDLVISDLNLPGASGLELLRTIRLEYPETAVVMITAFGTVETAVAALKTGAYDYLLKPIHLSELAAVADRALEHVRLVEEVRLHRNLDEEHGFESMIGRNRGLSPVLDQAARIAQTNATVLILGETGTGKEVLAKAIHFNSLRRAGRFVTINCGALSKELLESELFGHVRGSFTGAVTHKKGKVEIADGGSLFLDEIGEMPLELQVKLLRLIQEHEIEKVGALRPMKVDVRIIAATHRDLPAMIARHEFREDLYYRLAVVPIWLPPLRNRAEDIPQFVQQFFETLRHRHGKNDLSLPQHLLPYFSGYKWPGNVRELENTIERIVLLSRGQQVTEDDLPEFLRVAHEPLVAKPVGRAETAGLDHMQRDLILQALRKFGWNQTRAAQFLEISRKTLIYRMTKYGIAREEGA